MGSSEQRGGRRVFTWDEVQRHCGRTDRWLVIRRKVYDISEFSKRHPGGARLIGHYAGQDATVRGASISSFPLVPGQSPGAHDVY